jgi:hypothetical protein
MLANVGARLDQLNTVSTRRSAILVPLASLHGTTGRVQAGAELQQQLGRQTLVLRGQLTANGATVGMHCSPFIITISGSLHQSLVLSYWSEASTAFHRPLRYSKEPAAPLRNEHLVSIPGMYKVQMDVFKV